jgi:hypothetical protein
MRLKENGQSVAILQQIGREVFDSNNSDYLFANNIGTCRRLEHENMLTKPRIGFHR